MRPQDLAPTEVLASKAKHGTFIKFLGGCRCRRCVKRERDYLADLKRRHATEGRNNLISADEVRKFLLQMKGFGIGYMTIAKHVGVGKTGLGMLLWPDKKRPRQYIRRQKALKVLSYRPTLDTIPRMLRIPAEETIERVKQLVRWGYSKSLISTEGLHNHTCGLQIHSMKGKTWSVKASTAIRIRDFFDMIVAIRETWIEKRGPIPARHYVYWKPGTIGCTVRSMELRPFPVNYNYHYLYSPEMKEAMRMANRVKKEYRERTKKHAKESYRGPTQPPVCHPGISDRQGQAHAAGAS